MMRENLQDAFDPEKPMAFKSKPHKMVPESLYQTQVARKWLDLHTFIYKCDNEGWFGRAGVAKMFPVAGDPAASAAVAIVVTSRLHQLLMAYERLLQNDPDMGKLKRWKKLLLKEHQGLALSMLVRSLVGSIFGQPPLIGDLMVGLVGFFKVARLVGQHVVDIWARWQATEYGAVQAGGGLGSRAAEALFEEVDRVRPPPQAHTKNTQPRTKQQRSPAGRGNGRQASGKVSRVGGNGRIQKPARSAKR